MSFRFVLGGPDDEMATIRTLILAAIAAGLDAEIVEAAPGPRSEAQYASAVTPREGDVWIECAPEAAYCPECGGAGWYTGRRLLDRVGATRIDHHQPGDLGYGRPVEEAFAASSLGQLVRLLVERGVTVGEASPEWIATGAADHDPVAFAGGRIPGWTATQARAWLIARAVAGGRGVTDAQVVEALAMIEAAPTLPGFQAVYDLRGIPELCPATMGADRQPVPGTGGRLGSAAFVAVLALPGRAALNWGAQGIRPAGRHLGLIGDTAALPVAAILAAVPGIVDPYGAPGKACGGYAPVG